jgi:hypothetical protein
MIICPKTNSFVFRSFWNRFLRASGIGFAALAVGSLTQHIHGQTLPLNYQVQLQVRADTGGTAFNLPNGSTFNSVTPTLNDLGKVAVKVNTIGLTTSPGLWFGGQGTGGLVYNANDNAALLSDPYINIHNQISFPRFASTSAVDDGLYVYDNSTGMTARVTNGPLGATSYTNPQINDNAIIGMRAKFNSPQALLSYNIATNMFTNYVTETGGDPNSRYSFIFAPAFNNNNRLAAEANINGQASTLKELRIWNSDGTSLLVASGDSSTGPMFFAFDNSISMNNHDQVAFTTRTSSSSSTRRIVVGDGTATVLFPTVSAGAGFTSIDSFPPSINDHGLVAFRGNDNQSTPRDSVFVTDGTTVQRITGVNDSLMTDTGSRVVSFLMGAVKIDNSGSVAFGVQFSGGGNAIYVAYAPLAPLRAVSRKTHGAAGTFDIDMPLTGAVGIESRSGSGSNSGNHQLVITFPVPVTVGNAMVTTGQGAVDSVVTSGAEVTVNLTGVSNAQAIVMTLFSVNDGSRLRDIPISAGFLVADANQSGAVNSTDVGQVKAQAGQPVGASNFRSDVNASGAINSTDVSLAKLSTGTGLP